MNTNKDLILGEVFVDVPQKLDYTNIWDTTNVACLFGEQTLKGEVNISRNNNSC